MPPKTNAWLDGERRLGKVVGTKGPLAAVAVAFLPATTAPESLPTILSPEPCSFTCICIQRPLHFSAMSLPHHLFIYL